jgi:hypothetical protein
MLSTRKTTAQPQHVVHGRRIVQRISHRSPTMIINMFSSDFPARESLMRIGVAAIFVITLASSG